MALVLGTNCGFVSVAPVADPGVTLIGTDSRGEAFQHTTPPTAAKITEIGLWLDSDSGVATYPLDGEFAIYTESGTNPVNIVGSKATFTVEAADMGKWKVVSGLNIPITGNTLYWIASQIDDAVGGGKFIYANYENVGTGKWDRKGTGQTELTDPWGASLNNYTIYYFAIYAVWEVAPPATPEQAPGGLATKHDYKKFPELSNRQIQEFGWESPHPQITEDFRATVQKVTDGDTIRLVTDFRDFTFPLRFLDIDAPEMNAGGEVTKEWLKNRIEGREVTIIINPDNRVDKWGRLLGRVFHQGLDVGEEELRMGLAVKFGVPKDPIPNLDELLNIKKWLKT